MKLRHMALAVIIGLSATPALAGDIIGNWQRSDGAARIRMSPCGDGVCGSITWLKNSESNAKIGQRVFSNLKESGGSWSGSAFNPEDGKSYSGKATVSGNSMTTKGCALGGLICKSVSWNRI
jgi:uncharacterized protein (DUF2147 family)